MENNTQPVTDNKMPDCKENQTFSENAEKNIVKDNLRLLNDSLFCEVLEVFEKTHFITTDSRKINGNGIFVALKGDFYDANTFAKSAIDNGADLVIIDKPEYFINEKTLLIEDSLLFLQKFANYYRKTFDIPVIAISGTNGKTTTKELMYEVLSTKFVTQATQGNLNNQIGVPLTILSWKRNIEIAVVEMGASHIGDIDELCRIAEPSIGLLTNIGTAHIEGFGSFEGVVRTKTELYRYIEAHNGKVFVNTDDENLQKHAPDNKITYSLLTQADVSAVKTDLKQPFAAIELQKTTIHSHLVGSYNCYNMLAAATVGLFFSIDIKQIKQALEKYEPQNNRSQVKKTQKNTLILDCYNANPSSCRYALEAFNEISAKDKRIFIGEMRELGEVSQAEHKAIAEIILSMNLTQAVFVGNEYKSYAFVPKCFWFETSEEARNFFQTQNIKNSLILIKGSRATKMEILQDVL
ncbi:MAG: UDP-N-acetylmuramoyl-tripeptide--D-alanyl-D-alanine ligase [Bacteroidales bacterium]|nr:UDP-N-acetylmuramoyl-tripeptide--D-alanyl-D-alanine ligase [Bacteroidales bacterium]